MEQGEPGDTILGLDIGLKHMILNMYKLEMTEIISKVYMNESSAQ